MSGSQTTRSTDRPWLRSALAALAVFVLGLVGFLIDIDAPSKPYFDEVHYLPASCQFLEAQPPAEWLNREHPPLGKELMAVGIGLWGDNPFGWRFMSALFGALALAGFELWADALFAERRVALWATAILFLNQMLYIHARTAMLEIFALAFTFWAMAAFTAAWRPGAPVRLLMAAAGLCIGLATAVKWTGVVPWALCLGFAGLVTLRHWFGPRRTKSPARPDAAGWYRPDLWCQMRLIDWALLLGVLPLLTYAACFIPITGLSPAGIIAAQATALDLQARVPPTHTYMSSWYGWPVIARPIWYLFEQVGENRYEAIICLGNPVILWAGIPAFLACAWLALERQRRDAVVIAASFAAFYLFWAVTPRKLAFLYYYLPAASVLSLALAFMAYRTPLRRWPWLRHGFLLLAAASFLYFLPESDAAIPLTLEGFVARAWFPSWR